MTDIVHQPIIRIILEIADSITFINIIKTSKSIYECNKDLILSKRKDSLKLIETVISSILVKRYHMLPSNKKEGSYEKFDSDGHLYKICNYVNGKKDGSYKEFLDDGYYKICNYINGKKEGLYQEFFEDDLTYRCRYINGKKEGMCEEFDENNDIKARYNYINDKIEGIHVTYHSHGYLSICNYINDVKEGLEENFHKNGCIKLYYINNEVVSEECN